MQKKYTISMIFILILILGLFQVYFNYRIYQSEVKENPAITLMSNDLSVNFLNGNPVTIQEKEELIEFSITNYSSKKTFYSIEILPLIGDTSSSTYELLYENGNSKTFDFTENLALSRHEIAPSATERYTLKVISEKDVDFTFEIKIEVEKMNHEFQNVILSQDVISSKELNFSEASLSGLMKVSEQHGDIYYYRGDISNNYFKIGEALWRIVKVNEDGTVKLVLNGTTESMIEMMREESLKETFFDTFVYQSLEEYYKNHLMEYDEYIASTKYCYDNGVLTEQDNQFTYLSSVRIFTDYLPTNVCNGTFITSKVALLTADEVMFAGAIPTENKGYYLYDESLQSGWWTMTPSKLENGKSYFITVNKDGSFNKETPGTSKLFLKPVITLNRKVKVIGDGSKENPYMLER